jgi:molybdenum-dependent DNA-binding transcriptional regulator ModE
MPLITTKNGRVYTTVTINVETSLKSAAKSAGINFTKVFVEALKHKLEEIEKI